MDTFLQLTSSGICLGAIYGLGALGFVLIYKASQVFNMAHGHMMMVGAFFAMTFSVILGLPMWLAFLIAIMLGGLLGYLIQVLVMCRMMGQPLFGQIMATIGLMIMLQGAVSIIWGYRSRVYPGNIIPMGSIKIGGAIISPEYISGFLLACIVLAIVMIYFRITRSGLAMRGISDDEQLAESMGIRVRRMLGFTWLLAGMTAAVGGITLAMMTSVNLVLGELALKILPVVVFGGMESLGGAVVGGLIVGVSLLLSGGYLDIYLTGIMEVVPYILMLMVLLIRPYGLFGEKRIERI